MRTLYAVLVACVFGGGAHAESRVVGNWRLQIESDRFTDQTNVVALTLNNGGGLAIRCLQGNLSILVSEARTKYEEGDVFSINLRVDRQPVAERYGTAIGATFIEVNEEMPEIIKQIRDGRELAVRIHGKVSFRTLVFSLANVSRALAPLVKACPLDAAPPKLPGDASESF